MSMPLIAKVASMFSAWRCSSENGEPGGFLFRFHVVKTQFHSGRLRVGFQPYDFADSAKVQNMPAYNDTEVIDLSSGTDFTFFVPFVAVRSWLHTYYDFKTALASGDARNSAEGNMVVAVINPLVTTNTVASSVDVLVFVSMVNACFAAPIRPPISPYGIPNVAQIGTARVVKTSETSLVSAKKQIELLPYSSCFGEVVASFRQLSKRFSYVGSIRTTALDVVTPSGTQPGSSGNGFVIYPWAPVIPNNGPISVNAAGVQTPALVNQYQYVSPASATTSQFIYQYPDIFTHLYSMYAFFRGSVRYKINVALPGNNYNPANPIYIYINNIVNPALETWSPPMQITPAIGSGPSSNLGTGPIQPLFDIPANSATTLKTNFAYQPGMAEARMVVYPGLEGMIEFEVPFHATGPFCPTNYGQNNPTNARSIFYPFPTVTITGGRNPNAPQGNSLTNCVFDVFRACGDDFSFGGLLGAPQQAIWYSGVAPT